MTVYETEAILLAWHVSDGPQGHWVKFKLPLAITDGHPFALFTKGPEHGQRFRMTFEAIGNDELPTGHEIVGSAPSPSLADAADSPAAAPTYISRDESAALYEALKASSKLIHPGEREAKPKKHWDELKPSQQAGMMCDASRFGEWCGTNAPETRWDGRTFNSDDDIEDTADYVRWYCGVSSRSDLDTNPEAAKRWRELHSMFTADTQYGDRR